MLVYKAPDGPVGKPVPKGQPLSSLPVGALIKVDINAEYQSRFGTSLALKIASQNHWTLDAGYPANATSLIFNKIIQLMAFDANEPNNTVVNRRTMGNNNYSFANVGQWMNSDSKNGTWYTAKHSYDAPPISANVINGNAYADWDGFLSILHPRLVGKLLNTTLKSLRPNAEGGGYENLIQKIFLPSDTEIGLLDTGQHQSREGATFNLFETASNRIVQPTATAVSISEFKDASLNASSAWYWYLRTPNVYSASYVNGTVWAITPAGTKMENSSSNGGLGIRPCLNIPNSALVSLEPDTDGAYTLIWPDEPVPEVDEGLIPFSYTGTMEAFENLTHPTSGKKRGYAKLKASGTLTPNRNTNVDVFLVGGGSAGGGNSGGGGGGYTKTFKANSIGWKDGDAIPIVKDEAIDVVIGATASSINQAGNLTQFKNSTYLANGASSPTTSKAGSGGSGGGANVSSTADSSAVGGSDGANGGGPNGGTGQGHTTRAFGEPDGDLYAGGGGGYRSAASNAGGAGGGGSGGTGAAKGIDGAANTGGGGGASGTGGHGTGGSGIGIVRWGDWSA